jgi:hypothetical protein
VPENPLVCQLLLKFLNDEYAERVGISISGHIMMLFRSASRMETRLGLLYVWKGCTRPELFAKGGGEEGHLRGCEDENSCATACDASQLWPGYVEVEDEQSDGPQSPEFCANGRVVVRTSR